MITIENLKTYGADVATGLARCMNNEGFYLRLVNMELNDANFARLTEALDKGDAHEAFEAAHALKGALGNLAWTPLYAPVSELTERLRHADDIANVGELPGVIADAYVRLRALAE